MRHHIICVAISLYSKELAEFLEVLATLPDNEQEKVLAYAQGVSAGAAVAKSTSTEKVSA